METRKIQEVGGGTYTVSLPKDWADDLAVEAGSIVDIHTHIDDLLVIQPHDRSEDTTLRVFVRVDHDETDRLERTLRAAYDAGAEEVLFAAGDTFTREQRRAVNRTTSDLAGLTIDQETDSRLLLRMLLDPAEVSVWQSVRQLQFVALSMHREATAALFEKSTGTGVRNRDDEADRLFSMVDRHFDRALVRLDEVDALDVTRSELFEARTLARELERIADHAERIALVARRLDDPVEGRPAQDIRTLGDRARAVVEDAGHCVLDGGAVETAHDTLAVRDELVADIDALETRLFDADSTPRELVRVVDSLDRTAEIGGTIAELRIRTAIRQGELNESRTDTDGSGTEARANGE